MRWNGRMLAAALAGVLVAGGTAGGYLLTAGSAKADNATQCEAIVNNPTCTLSDIPLPATAYVYLQFNPHLDTGITARAQATWTAVCGGKTFTDTQTALPPNVLYITQDYSPSCTVTASLQVWFAGPAPVSLTSTYVTMQLDYITPFATTPPPSGGGGHGGGGLSGAIKGPGGKCVDDAGNSSKLRAKVDIWSCNHGKAQNWTYSGGEVKHNGLCLNAKSNGSVILWTCNAAPNEIWIFNTINHQVLLKAHGFTQCLTDPRGSTKNGTQLVASACKNNASQHWSLPGH